MSDLTKAPPECCWSPWPSCQTRDCTKWQRQRRHRTGWWPKRRPHRQTVMTKCLETLSDQAELPRSEPCSSTIFNWNVLRILQILMRLLYNRFRHSIWSSSHNCGVTHHIYVRLVAVFSQQHTVQTPGRPRYGRNGSADRVHQNGDAGNQVACVPNASGVSFKTTDFCNQRTNNNHPS